MTTSNLSIATIAGDGTGPEVTSEAIKVLDAVARLEGFEFTVESLDWGGDRYLRTGEIIPEGVASMYCDQKMQSSWGQLATRMLHRESSRKACCSSYGSN